MDLQKIGEVFSRHCGPLVELSKVEVVQVPSASFASDDLVEFSFEIPSLKLKHVVGVRPIERSAEEIGRLAGDAADDWADRKALVSYGRG